jgi:hypothetical protein
MDKIRVSSMAAVENRPYQGRFNVRIIRAGLSENRNFYADEVLRNAVMAFEGSRVFAKSDAQHLRLEGRDVRNLVGRISDVSFRPGNAPDNGELYGTLELLEPEGHIGTMLREASSRGMTDMFGLSIDARARHKIQMIDGKPARVVTGFIKVESVDLIVDPGAGGGIINLIESRKINSGVRSHAMDDEELALDSGDIRRIVEATRLPAPAKSRLVKTLAGPSSSRISEAAVRKAIGQEADYLASLSDSGKVRNLGESMQETTAVRLVESRDTKVRNMLDAFFNPADRSVMSIRECYLDITGDRGFTGLTRNCDESRLRESLGAASFGDVLGDSISRRLVTEYRNDGVYDVWKNLASVVPVSDFRTQERTRFGGYGDLPVVTESDPYIAMSSPGDEKSTYAVVKRGGTEDLTLEMITNDDVGAIQRIPRKLVRSAKRTLGKFVLDFLRTNPTIYDSVTLFHGTHGNLGTAALDATSVAAGRLAMKAQTERDSVEKIGIGPRYLWVSDDLEETAVNLFRRNTEQDRSFLQSLSLEVMPVWYWTDSNDWCLTADPLDIPVVEIGFLGGNEEPELFVQDSPVAGSMFTHDKVTYKIRHIYGGTIVDYRGAYKSVVA